MTQRHKFRKSMNRAAGPAIAVIVVMAMIGYIIFGPTGLYAWGEYGQSVEKKRVVLSQLTKKQNELQNRVNLLDRQRVDPDLAEEYVREKLGAYHPDEVIIPMDSGTRP
ncbi:MAG: septum formation initiator family protein [Sphingopyxis sp.]|uniref:FtsB family cell division protein n=1 Tax=Sphingopyxis sp. TaxID=1908224 RepID=UPI001A19EB96|nr:septum formation initiator family protein [Sphingopyxis sp.]MBJ7502505.1 septum formation initiator family protein [Sphingopyxis sp.]